MTTAQRRAILSHSSFLTSIGVQGFLPFDLPEMKVEREARKTGNDRYPNRGKHRVNHEAAPLLTLWHSDVRKQANTEPAKAVEQASRREGLQSARATCEGGQKATDEEVEVTSKVSRPTIKKTVSQPIIPADLPALATPSDQEMAEIVTVPPEKLEFLRKHGQVGLALVASFRSAVKRIREIGRLRNLVADDITTFSKRYGLDAPHVQSMKTRLANFNAEYLSLYERLISIRSDMNSPLAIE